jgi:aspartate kinase
MVVVVKFGGSTLGTAEGVSEAAKGVMALSETEPVAVVVSARGRLTDRLYDEMTEVNPETDAEVLEPYLVTGETQSVYVFVSALRMLGAKADPVIPFQRDFPLRVQMKRATVPARGKGNEVRRFKVLWKLSRAASARMRERLKERRIAVVAGFAGRTGSGKVVTLGRGGSDITSFIMARLLKAREVILVKDTEGVMSADPRFSVKGRKVRTLSREALASLIAAGSQVLHPGTLPYLSEETRIRFADRSLKGATGTEVLRDPYFEFKNAPEEVSAVTVIGHGFSENPSVIGRLLTPLEKHRIRVVGTALFEDNLTVYVSDRAGEEAYILLSREATRLSQVTTTHLRRSLARLVVEHRHLLDEAQGLIRALRALRAERVMVHGALVLRSEFHIFIPSEDLSRAVACLFGPRERPANAVSTPSH